MQKHGIFINHRHNHRLLAGRIYDFFLGKGMEPFLDVYSLQQGHYQTELSEQIKNAPYFLCVLTKGALDDLDENDVYYKEIETAFDSEREILVIISEDFEFPKELPPKISELYNCQYYIILNNMSNFYHEMEKLCQNDICLEKLEPVINWRKRAQALGKTSVLSRKNMENSIATLNNRFGKEFVDCVRDGKPFNGEFRIKHVHMSCYSANLIFTPDQSMVDERAYDRGMMFNIFAYLLQDNDFSLEIVTNAPNCFAAKDAIENEKLGNSSLEEYPEAVFLSSYASINALIQNDPIYQKATKERRFRFMITENVMPYAIFQITYKQGWEELNHVKVDLYSEGLVSNMERRSMLFFERDDKENYDFFVNRYNYLRNPKKSKELMKQYHDSWIQQWNDYLNDII